MVGRTAGCRSFWFIMNYQDRIIVASEAGISIQSLGDISDAIGKCFGAKGLIVTEADVSPDFFNLRTGFAGELLQKFVNYKIQLAIILPSPNSYGERFAELASEHSMHPTIRFFSSKEQAIAWLEK